MKRIALTALCSMFSAGLFAQYTGTASVTQGEGDTLVSNLFTCTGGRVTNLGTITASDSTVWPLPAAIRYSDPIMPASSDLYNSCNGHAYPDAASAIAALTGGDIIDIDPGGELFTMYIFADNYFELYINGQPAGRDNVPYTPFNSSIVRFRAVRPFTIAMLLVDWEEHLGVGCETNNTYSYYVGDGGMVAVIKDSAGTTIAKTGPDWRAQTYYTAPIRDLRCAYETGQERRSDTCSTQSSNNGSSYYGLHWSRPADWEQPWFPDTSFPAAYTFTNATVGVNNKPAYTNFTALFDDPSADAQFIWSSNLVLDNEVLVRYTVPSATTGMNDRPYIPPFDLYPNPARASVRLRFRESGMSGKACNIAVHDLKGRTVFSGSAESPVIPVEGWAPGVYTVSVEYAGTLREKQLIIQ